jgi:hypothetical protein
VTIGVPDFQDPRQPQPTNDLLLNGTIGVGSTTFSGNLATPSGIYLYFGVILTLPMAAVVEVSLDASGAPNNYTVTRYTVAGGQVFVLFPANGFLEAVNSVVVILSTAVVTSAAPVQVYGYRSFPSGLRYDGLYPAQNSVAQSIPATAGTNPINLGVPTPQRGLIGAITPPAVILGAAAGEGYITGYIGGIQYNLASGAGAAGQPMVWNTPDMGSGVLLDPGTSMAAILPTVASGAAGCVLYDVVT